MTSTMNPPSFKREDAFLMVVDMQGSLFHQTTDVKNVTKHAKIIIQGAKLLSIPIIVMEQYPKGLGPTDPEIIEALGEAYQPIEKKTFSGLIHPPVIQAVEKLGRKQMLLIGIESHVCVHQTCIHGLQMGLQVYFAKDAISSRTEENRSVGFEKMMWAGAIPTTAEMVLFEWMVTAETPEFKAISALVR